MSNAPQAKPEAKTDGTLQTHIQINPFLLMLSALLSGMLFGAVLVLLDPTLRFGDFPMRPNIPEAVLSACVIGGYGALLSWLITTFWRTRLLWVMVVLTTPLLTAALLAWNSNTTAFGTRSDLLLFLPFVLIFHMVTVLMLVVYLNLVLKLGRRRALAYTGIPVVLAIFTFLVLGQLRWREASNIEALDVVNATDQYATGALPPDTAYSIEFVGIRYGDRIAPQGNTRIYAEDVTLYCRVRLLPTTTETECEIED